MNNQTESLLPYGVFVAMGYLPSIFSLLFILIVILITLFILFFKQKKNNSFDEHGSRNDETSSGVERKSFQLRRSKKYSATSTTQEGPSTNSFQLDIDEQNTRSTLNLLSPK